MQLLIIVILGAVLGFSYGSAYYGFLFSSKICLFAGLTLIMPSLFKFKLSDIKLTWTYKSVILKGFAVNYIALPAIAITIGLITKDFGIASGIFLLSVLSGGGMVMHWIKKSGGDTSFGFLLLFANLIFVSLSFLMLHIVSLYTAHYYGASYGEEHTLNSFVYQVIVLLIVIPFIVSRVIIQINPLVLFIEKYRSYISGASIFLILFYLFGLQSSQQLVDLYDFEPELFWHSLLGVLGFYTLSTLVSVFVYDLDSPQERAAFWHSITRYITLALVLSTFTTNTFGVSMLIPIMLAYLVQIPLSVILDKRYLQK